MTPVIDTVPGARPVVELGAGDTHIPTGLGRWDVSEWDDIDAQWAGTEPSWVDITCFVHDIEFTVGRDRTMQRWEVGSATLTVDNDTGWADMGQGPPPEPFALTVRPGRQLRIGMALDGGPVRWMWRGFIDDAEPFYHPEQHDVVTLACIDAKGEAGKVDLARVAPAVGVGEYAATRIGRILDLAGWRAQAREIAPTSVRLTGTELGGRAVDLLDVAADSAGGAVFGDARGYVVFTPRDWQTFAPSTPNDGTIGNVTGLDANDVTWETDPVTFDADPVIFGQTVAGDVCPSGWERAFRRGDIATRTVVGRKNEPGRTFDDSANQILYGIETVERTDLEAFVDSQLDLLGERWLKVLSADYMPRVAAVTIDAATGTAQRDLAATVDPTKPSRYRCRHHRGGDVVFDAEFFATGVRHTISRDSWVCRITLDDAAPFMAVGGRWDQASWDQALWADLAVHLELLLADVQRVTA